MQGRTVVVVEDDDHIADLVALYLGQAGFAVARATRADEGEALVAEHQPALAVVDIGLPGGVDGLELCRRLRRDSRVPILILTARGDEADRVVGLELGADDYVTKPFSPRELVARIRAILRRSDDAPASDGTVVVGDVEVDLARHEARRDGRPVALAPREFALLAALVDNRGIVLSRRQLLDLAWGYDWYGDERTVDAHIRQLRRKLGDGLPLATVKRAGYRLA